MEKFNVNNNEDLLKRVSSKELDEYRKEIYNKIINDEVYSILVGKFGLNNDEIFKNLSKCDDFYENYHLVKQIKTYEDCVKFNIFDKMILYKNGNLVEIKYEVLEPVKQKIEYLNSYIIKDFDDSFNDLSSTKMDSVGKGNLKKVYALFNRKKINWAYLYGGPRTGKSYVSIAFLNSMVINKKVNTACFINSSERFKELQDLKFAKNKFSNAEFERLFESYKTCDILVIDSFGDEFKSKYQRDTFLIPILKERASKRLFTVFTSNFNLHEIQNLYTFDKYDPMGKQVKSLIESMMDEKNSFIDLSGQAGLY